MFCFFNSPSRPTNHSIFRNFFRLTLLWGVRGTFCRSEPTNEYKLLSNRKWPPVLSRIQRSLQLESCLSVAENRNCAPKGRETCFADGKTEWKFTEDKRISLFKFIDGIVLKLLTRALTRLSFMKQSAVHQLSKFCRSQLARTLCTGYKNKTKAQLVFLISRKGSDSESYVEHRVSSVKLSLSFSNSSVTLKKTHTTKHQAHPSREDFLDLRFELLRAY